VRLSIFIAKRLLVAIPQVLAITVVTFWLVRLLPGNPAYELVGPYATKGSVAAMEAQLGLNKPIYTQFGHYVSQLLHGNLGISWFTTDSVSHELLQRLPATLELISIASFFIVIGGIALGAVTALGKSRVADAIVRYYGLLAGALPDFFLGLLLIFILFYLLGWLPAPTGRLALRVAPPPQITGFYTVDSLLAGDWAAFGSAVGHLVLPVATLVTVYGAAIVKMTRSSVEEALASDMAAYARACGLSNGYVLRYAIRNSLPPVVTLIGITYGYLLGGAVLVEQVFSWGGLGSWVVDSALHSDYFPIQAFVLVAAVFNFVIYLLVDVIHFALDPRVEY
jgi:peptide/nickel transport system permease protein